MTFLRKFIRTVFSLFQQLRSFIQEQFKKWKKPSVEFMDDFSSVSVKTEKEEVEDILTDREISLHGVTKSRLLPEVVTIQLIVASTIFSKIGADYVPRRLILGLREMDVFVAVEGFLNSMNFDLGELLRDREEREKLNELILRIVELDWLINESKVSDVPFYKVAATHDLNALDRILNRYRKTARIIAGIKKTIEESDVIFPEARSDFELAKEYLKAWENIEEGELDEISKRLDYWFDWQKTYENYKTEIKHLIFDIQSFMDAESDFVEGKHRLLFDSIVEDVDLLIEEVSEGKVSIEGTEGWDAKFQGYYADLSVIFDTITYGYKGDHRKTESESETIDWDTLSVDELLSFLELKYRSDMTWKEVKKAYKKMARKYHPDFNPGDKSAEEMMKNIISAYETLKKEVYAAEFST